MSKPRPLWAMKAAWMFSNTVSLGKMLVRWNERAMPMPQILCGATPVMSRSSSNTSPLSGCRCPVMRLKRVDLPAPLGPITAVMRFFSTLRLTSLVATKPENALRKLLALEHQARPPARDRDARGPAWRTAPATPPGNANSSTSSMMPSKNGQYSV